MKKNKTFLLFFTAIIFLFAGFFLLHKNSSPAVLSDAAPSFADQKSKATVVRVIDGDTIDVLENGAQERIRLLGMDTPEIVDPKKPVACFGKEASDFVKTSLTGKSVLLVADETQGNLDKYKRLLRYVFLEDGTNFDLLLIEDGYAREYTYSKPYEYQKEFRSAEAEAKASGKGLWSACL